MKNQPYLANTRGTQGSDQHRNGAGTMNILTYRDFQVFGMPEWSDNNWKTFHHSVNKWENE